MAETKTQVDINDSYLEKYGFHEDEKYTFKTRRGIDAEVVKQISHIKNEPEWMTDFRLRAYESFESKPMPNWGSPALKDIRFEDIFYYLKPTDEHASSWEELPIEIRNTYDKLGIPEAEKKYLAGVGAQYECLAGDVRVYTARGLVPIREIEPGDVVFSFDEANNHIFPAHVRATAAKGERQVFEVRVGNRTIRATANHPFLALSYHRKEGKQRGRYKREWKYLSDLKPGDLVAVAKMLPDVGQSHLMGQPEIKTKVVGRNQTGVEYELDITRRYKPVSLPETSSADLMWWFGLYVGDGFIHHTSGADKARVEFAIPETDASLRSELDRVTQALFGQPATNGDPNRMSINSTILARYIEANGFSGNAHTKRIPGWVFSLPEEQRLALLGGYADADGYVRDHVSNHDMSFTSTSSELLEQFRALAATCGVQSSAIHHFESKHPFDKTRKVDGYRLQLSGNFDRIGCRSPQRTSRLGKRSYYHHYTHAKGTTFLKHTSEYIGFAKIDSIAPARVELVFDIEVDGPHNFVAEGLIVHNSEVIYHNLSKELAVKGVIFLDTDTALKDHPDLFRQYFGTIIPYTDNKFAALNSAVWSGGSFIYVPPGVKIELPLQAYFRINAKNMGQFERTLIIVDEGAYVHYVEGCTAPIYSSDSLHSAVVEIIVKKGGRCRYSTIQNWSTNVYNLVTKRAVAYQDATMEWVDCNLGCLAEGSTVTTPDGVKTIELLNVGDKVLSYDEHARQLCFRAVTAKRYSGRQKVHTVSIGERTLRVTPNHPFYSYLYDDAALKKLGRYRPGYVRADQLEEAIIPRASIAYGAPHKLHSHIELPESLEVADVEVSELSVDPVPTWDIEVEGTGNFVAQDFIVHNSKLTMKYPAVYLMEPGAHGEILSITFAGKGQHQDAGAKVVHAAPNTTSKIVSKSLSKDGGRTSYRGLLKVYKNAHGSRSNVSCDALLLDEHSRSDTYPYIEVDEDDVSIGHEASVSKIGEEQLFYAMSRGLSQEEATSMVVSGFIEPLVKELPMEYALEMNRLIALQMEGSVG